MLKIYVPIQMQVMLTTDIQKIRMSKAKKHVKEIRIRMDAMVNRVKNH